MYQYFYLSETRDLGLLDKVYYGLNVMYYLYYNMIIDKITMNTMIT